MLLDLVGQGIVEREADYLIIGAGTVGLPVSVLLAEKFGVKVICLESGAEKQDEDTHPFNEVVHRASEYGGAAHGRFRCLGGTSSRWGGALIPFQAADLASGAWPLTMADLENGLADVEELFSLDAGPYEDPHFPFPLGPDHVNRLAKWPPFRKRNVVNVVGEKAREQSNLEVWLNATATKIEAMPGGENVRVVARTVSGDQITVRASKLIICAGAIETTRLALLIDQQNGSAISAVSPSLGRYFSDHISIGVAEVIPKRAGALNRIIGFRFDKAGTMRNIRFELAPDSTLRGTLPPSFTHIGFETDAPGGFDALREVFRNLQKRRLPSISVGLDLLRNLPWLVRAVWWRFAEKRLLFPSNARLVANVVIEQTPDAENYIALSPDKTDAFGLPLAEINWSVRDTDIDLLNRTADAFEKSWQNTQFAELGDWKRYPADEVGRKLKDSEGIYHPTSSTRMGPDAATGVVDADLRLFAFPQIQLLATSVLPTGGGANPTMMLFLLAMRCVRQHGQMRKVLHGS